MLHLLLRNLVYNAIKFTPQGGEVRVGANYLPQFQEIFVADNGVGISPKSIEGLFRIDKQSTTLWYK